MPTTSPNPVPEHVSLQRAAEIFDRDESTIRRWIRRGDLDAVKIGGRVAITLDALAAAVKPVVPR